MSKQDEHVDAKIRLDDSDSEVTITDQNTSKRTWLGYIWDTADLGKEERKLLTKVDASLLVFASLGYFIKKYVVRLSAVRAKSDKTAWIRPTSIMRI
jgi:hypothetical protein